jgi:hypothetical protein
MKLGRFTCDKKPPIVVRHEALVSWLPRGHKYGMSTGRETFVATHIGLFPPLFSMHFRSSTSFDTLKRKKNV